MLTPLRERDKIKLHLDILLDTVYANLVVEIV